MFVDLFVALWQLRASFTYFGDLLGVVHNCHHFHERTQRTLGGRPCAFLNVVYSDGNEIIAHVRRTIMAKNPLVLYSLLVQKLVT